MYTIRKRIERPDPILTQQFQELATPLLSDVMGRHHVMDAGIRPVYKGATICGPAFTALAYPSDNLMIHAALKFAERGDVIVADAGGFANAGLWGEIMTVNALRKGVAGLVIDGGCRDIDELEACGFPVFARGINARGGFKLDGGSVNDAVSCGGVCVQPGDLIVADACGVCVVPRTDMKEVLKLALEKLASEETMKARLRGGEDFFDITGMEAYLEKLGVRYLD
jgi:4-hydroxy-4-methyl-2-oxoglutarate aldolase